MYRDYDLLVDGKPVGECVSIWVLVRASDRKILRLESVEELQNTGGGELCKTKKLTKLRLPEEMKPASRRRMQYSDTDINGHVNNCRYADFACDALEMQDLAPGKYLSELQIGYLAECRPGDELEMQLAREEDQYYVRGMDEAGKSRFEASMIFGEVLP